MALAPDNGCMANHGPRGCAMARLENVPVGMGVLRSGEGCDVGSVYDLGECGIGNGEGLGALGSQLEAVVRELLVNGCGGCTATGPGPGENTQFSRGESAATRLCDIEVRVMVGGRQEVRTVSNSLC